MRHLLPLQFSKYGRKKIELSIPLQNCCPFWCALFWISVCLFVYISTAVRLQKFLKKQQLNGINYGRPLNLFSVLFLRRILWMPQDKSGRCSFALKYCKVWSNQKKKEGKQQNIELTLKSMNGDGFSYFINFF